MPRYIDADKLWNSRPENLDRNKNDYCRGWDDYAEEFYEMWKNAPTADVVPRSEYEKMKEKADRFRDNLKAVLEERSEIATDINVGNKAKQDVVREIFEELEHTIMHPNWASDTYRKWYFAELKKKYIGEGNERSKG